VVTAGMFGPQAAYFAELFAAAALRGFAFAANSGRCWPAAPAPSWPQHW